MSYIVFARKYRPQTFDDVIGQSHITTTLKNAIAQSRVAHAYIFAGPRGVGKTTTARILAKALNCDKGPTAKPCNTCPSCLEITQGSSLDILEIDGASNRGIEEIRSLRENIKFAPSKGRFKIYIIDEVHMLTSEAFNALLKSLEEPPAHVKFIFATTAPHKVPATILSRCQRFDFRRISTKDVLENLTMIAADQKIDFEDEALGLIARHSDGSMRDGQVILDQMASSGRGRIRVADVTKILGVVDDEILFGISDSIKTKDAAKALSIIDRLVDEGKDPVQVVLGLIEHFRNISVAKISRDAGKLIEAGPDKVERYKGESGRFSMEEILYIIYTLSNTIDFMRKTPLARIPFEAAMVKLTQIPEILNIADIVSRLEAMDKGGAVAAPAAKPVPAKVAPVKNESAPAPQQDNKSVSVSPDLEELAGCWTKVISFIRPKKISVASYLQEGYPNSLESNVLTVAFPKECQFHKEVLESLDNRRLIEDALKEVTGMDLKVALALTEPIAPGREFASSADGAQASGETAEPGGGDADPIVKAAMDIFNGKISRGGNGGVS